MRIFELILTESNDNVSCEEEQVRVLQDLLRFNKNSQPVIKIKLGNKDNSRVVEVADILWYGKGSGLKADVELKNAKQEGVAWISLKCDRKRSFKWGKYSNLQRSMSSQGVGEIDVPYFIEILKKDITGTKFQSGDKFKLTTPENIKPFIMYGKNFGGTPGSENVDIVLLGKPSLTRDGDVFILTGGDDTYVNGELPRGGDDPVLTVNFRNPEKGKKFNDFGIQNCNAEAMRVVKTNSYPSLDDQKNIDRYKELYYKRREDPNFSIPKENPRKVSIEKQREQAQQLALTKFNNFKSKNSQILSSIKIPYSGKIIDALSRDINLDSKTALLNHINNLINDNRYKNDPKVGRAQLIKFLRKLQSNQIQLVD